jgi:magnesium-transporting ATPase (P-type)
MKISDLVTKNLVNVNLKSHTKETVFSEILDAVNIKNKKEILDKFLEREKTASTYIGNGLAIPHVRIENLKEPILFVGIAKHGINFSDSAKAKIIVLFITAIEDTSTHLKIISKLAAICKDKILLNRILSSKTNDELLKILKQIDVENQGFFALTKEEIYTELETKDNGLFESEAKKRLEDYGENELKAIKKKSLIIRFCSHLINFLALLMWGAAILSFLSDAAIVGWVIIVVVFLNAIFGFFQEFKAEKAIESLRKLFPSYARVIRSSKEQKIFASELVPGDIIIFEEGDNIPADARLIEAYELRVNNSAFSGESQATYKMSSGFENDKNFLWLEMPNLVFAGTSVVNGYGKAVVIATGMSTEIGKIAYLTQTVKEELSPLQKEINKVIKIISLISIIMGLVFFIVGLFFTEMTFFGVLIFVIGVITANVPQGLMPTITLSLSLAVQKMAKRKALIKKLSSVETLGCTNVICTDKTGTLTTNQMCIKKIWLNNKKIEVTGTGYDPNGGFLVNPENFRDDNLELLVLSGVLCNTAKLIAPSLEQNFWSIIGDPTEAAILTLSKKMWIDYEKEREINVLEKRFPFESA